jgi:hypothetical protein
MQRNSGVITASLFVMLLAGVVSGGVVGLVLGGVLASLIAVAFICAFIGAFLALVLGNAILGHDARFALPSGVMIWNVIIGRTCRHELCFVIAPPSQAVEPPANPVRFRRVFGSSKDSQRTSV